jgi:hypothetical protein
VVVDDASGDDTAEVAAEYADTVLRLEGSARGPAYARNRGAEAARGEVLVFIDADVCVHPPALGAMAAAFLTDSGLAAVFGSYDANPTSPGLVSQFRNLLHHHVHHLGAGRAETFWAGCGAVRRAAFFDVGMMDAARYPRPQIEDIELGRRLRQAGHRIELRPDIQCTHLKRWTLRNMVVTDFRDRGLPWMRLILSEGAMRTPATMNLKFRDKVCHALVAVAALALAAALLLRSATPLLLAAAATLAIVLLNHRFYSLMVRARWPAFAIAAVPLHLVYTSRAARRGGRSHPAFPAFAGAAREAAAVRHSANGGTAHGQCSAADAVSSFHDGRRHLPSTWAGK